MTVFISVIVTKNTQCEGILVNITRVSKKIFNKIPAADIVNQLSEQFTAKRVISKVRHHATAISKCVCVFQFFITNTRKFLFKDGNKDFVPVCINDRFMSEH